MMMYIAAGRAWDWHGNICNFLSAVQPGEWIQSASAIVGVALTVWAAGVLEDRKRRLQREDEQRLVREAVDQLSRTIPAILQEVEQGLSLVDRIRSTREQYSAFVDAQSTFIHAHAHLSPAGLNLWASLSRLHRSLGLMTDRLNSEDRIIHGDNVSEQVWAISREKIVEFATDAEPYVTRARDAFRSSS
jgi:hypothetical protein